MQNGHVDVCHSPTPGVINVDAAKGVQVGGGGGGGRRSLHLLRQGNIFAALTRTGVLLAGCHVAVNSDFRPAKIPSL